MSKTIKIKGKEFSEETIVAALKAHTDWPDYVFKAGDIVATKGCGNKRLVVQQLTNGEYKLFTVDRFGMVCHSNPKNWQSIYKIVGKCCGFRFETS